MKKTIFIPILATLSFFQLAAQQGFNSNTETQATFIEHEQVFDGEAEFPESDGWVTDLEAVFTATQEAELETMISDFEEASTHEIALVTLNSFEPYKDVSEYAASLGNRWELGKAGSQNGVVLLFSREKNLIHITAGEGVKNALTDKVCQEIISYTIIPEFQKENYYEGIKLGLQQIMEKLNSGQPND